MIYKETYKDLCHGTDVESAQKIRENGFELRESKDSWCGIGIYFYDIKKKAWWAANRKCLEIKKDTGKRTKPTVLFADILDLEDSLIFDLRVHKDLSDFENKVNELFSEHMFEIKGVNDNAERTIILRSMLISYYADRNKKKLIIGNFRQRPQPKHEHAIKFSNNLDMVFGIETIYCVKDNGIIENIR